MTDSATLKKNFVEQLSKAIEKGVWDPKAEAYVTAPAAYFTVALQFLEKTGNLRIEDKPKLAELTKRLTLPFSDGVHSPPQLPQ